jgi:hypothetical protein
MTSTIHQKWVCAHINVEIMQRHKQQAAERWWYGCGVEEGATKHHPLSQVAR